jgi:outer membrane protein OmpA-like peptidoglycan-associated protein
MNTNCRLPLLIALTIALAACGEDKDHNYTGMGGDTGGSLPGVSDQVNAGGDGGGIPPTRLPANINPDNADYQTLASDTIYFDFDKSTISASERGKLEAVSEWFKANPGDSLFLAGHADKRGTPEYNRALGERRALAVREYLVGLGLPAASLYTNSYGSDRPAVDGDTEEAYAKNRRVEIGVIVQRP